jgi:hypothetical protein
MDVSFTWGRNVVWPVHRESNFQMGCACFATLRSLVIFKIILIFLRFRDRMPGICTVKPSSGCWMNNAGIRHTQMSLHLRKLHTLYFVWKIQTVCTEPDHFFGRVSVYIVQSCALQNEGGKNGLIGPVLFIDIHDVRREFIVNQLPFDICFAWVRTATVCDLVKRQSRNNERLNGTYCRAPTKDRRVSLAPLLI